MLRRWCAATNEEADDDIALIALALGDEGERKMQEYRRGPTYLLREDLRENPRDESAWEAVYAARNDRAFIKTTGFDVAAFTLLLRHFEPLWTSTPIPRNDVDPSGEPRPNRRTLAASAALALALHYLNSTMPDHSLQQIFAVTPSVCNRYLHFGLKILLRVLRQMPQASICWPSNPQQFADYATMIRGRYRLLKSGFCFVDGLNLPVATARDEDVQNAYYNGWTCSHYCSSVFAFAPDGTIIYCSLNAPGSWHDAVVAHGLYERLYSRTPPGYYAIADTAFPRNQTRMEGRIRVPLKPTSQVPGRLQAQGRLREHAQLIAFNSHLVSARQAAEWGMRSLQGSFSRLKLPLPAEDHAFRHQVLEICSRLHQVRARVVGINQIKTVYERVWRDTDPDAKLYEEFRTMLFKDIARNDRIARFYRLDQDIINAS